MPIRNAAPPAPAVTDTDLDLTGLRGFVTVVDLDDIAPDPQAAGAYFAHFGSEDDATLLIRATVNDPEWAQWITRRMLTAGGADPECCADVRLCIVDDGWETADRLSRRAHAVIANDDASWLPWRRPVHHWDALAHLRLQAERSWGPQTAIRTPYSYEAAIEYLVAGGHSSEFHARSGSIPEPSLATITETFRHNLPPGPPRVLQVGNFLGVSLAHLLDWAASFDGSVVSIDAGIPHRAVQDPQRAVRGLLAHFGLNESHLLVCGYSLHKCVSNDSVVYEGYDPAREYDVESAPENVLLTLARAGHRFDFALVDGNHEASYLRAEVEAIAAMLSPGGLLVIDDVDDVWESIRDVYGEVSNGHLPLESLLTDGRVGILRRI